MCTLPLAFHGQSLMLSKQPVHAHQGCGVCQSCKGPQKRSACLPVRVCNAWLHIALTYLTLTHNSSPQDTVQTVLLWLGVCCNLHHKWQHMHQSVFGGCQSRTQTAWLTLPACAGEEVTISYQAHQLQTHVEARQEATQNWGFHCKCLRCQAEMSIPPSVNKALQTLRANVKPSPCAPGSVLASFRCWTHFCTHLYFKVLVECAASA